MVCSISTVLLRLTDVDENVMETALSRSVTCKLKCTGFMQTLDFFPPIQYPDIAFFFSYGLFRRCEATCIKMFLLMHEAHFDERVSRGGAWLRSGGGKQMAE